MNRIKVHVGVVFTQAMFCDENGKIHYHKVMTDVDKPWMSVVEAISELKQSFPEQTIPWNHNLNFLDLQMNFTNVHYSDESIREKLSCSELESTDLTFHIKGEEAFHSLTRVIKQAKLEESIRSNGVLSLLREHMAIPDSYSGEKMMDLKEYFHQELGRLYEGNWGSLFLWEEFDYMEVNTS